MIGLKVQIIHDKLIYMYAVYSLDENDDVNKFIGYIPATFFEQFTSPELWGVEFKTLPNNNKKVGRTFGKAFFVSASHLKASPEDVINQMGEEALAELDKFRLDSEEPL